MRVRSTAVAKARPVPFQLRHVRRVLHLRELSRRRAGGRAVTATTRLRRARPRAMKIFLTSAYPFDRERNFGPQWLTQHANPRGQALLAADPATADCILFVENHPDLDPYFLEVRRNPLYRELRDRCVL